ncbi:MAG: TolB family protein [Acidimicrobiia bacterium]
MQSHAERITVRFRVAIAASVLALLTAGCGVLRVSVSSSGTEGAKASTALDVTDDGRFSLFASDSDNLVPGDTNGASDVFRHDATTGATVRVDLAENGSQLADGAFFGAVSQDGRYVAFTTAAKLDPGDTNGTSDVYVRDLMAGTTTWASQPPAGGLGSGGALDNVTISADGRYVSFFWQTPFFPPNSDLYRRDRQAGTTTRVLDGGHLEGMFASADSRHYVVTPTCFQGGCFPMPIIVDTDGSANGWPALPFAPCKFQNVSAMSSNGRYLVWTSAGGAPSPCLAAGTYLVDRKTGVASLLSNIGDVDNVIGVSRDATAIVYIADGSVLPGGTPSRRDLYVRDLVHHTDARLNLKSDGKEGNADVLSAVLSDGGHEVAFVSAADNLVANDHNGVNDVFVRPIGVSPAP